ncbi:MAG: sigma 54-interacting transcriptional regulator [Polyangiaceae bacterium]|nr:sigma 54-interacting transcriptional regulator [Polyangiaceae bacterium]
MAENTTSAMQVYGAGPSGDGGGAGLVPLYVASAEPVRSVYSLFAQRVEIGREAGCDIVVHADAVSRRHAMIERSGGETRITDMGSRNGTIVDGAFITTATLEHGAEVRVGDAVFKYVAEGASAYFGYRFDGTMEGGARRKSAPSTLLGGATIDDVVSRLEKIATTMLSVIVQGESGTGKEVAASEVHRLSGRRGAFVPVNCAAIPATLLESELFGYRKGAFSGADRDKVGLVRAAHGGTLFLDEIGDMPPEAQAKLLRVLQAREVMPVGATQAEGVDVRVVCATHRDLTQLQQRGTFRGDLFARLNEYAVTLTPLRDRKEDVYLLARAMLARHGREDLRLAFSFVLGLLHYDWPFNVRELEACIKRAIALAEGPELTAAHLSDAQREAMLTYGRREDASASRPPSTPSAEIPPFPGARAGTPTPEELRALLAAHRGNVAAVGRVLGKERMQIHRWMKRYGIEVGDYR